MATDLALFFLWLGYCTFALAWVIGCVFSWLETRRLHRLALEEKARRVELIAASRRSETEINHEGL